MARAGLSILLLSIGLTVYALFADSIRQRANQQLGANAEFKQQQIANGSAERRGDIQLDMESRPFADGLTRPVAALAWTRRSGIDQEDVFPGIRTLAVICVAWILAGIAAVGGGLAMARRYRRLSDQLELRDQSAKLALDRANRTLRARSLSNLALLDAADEASYLNRACGIIVDACGYTMVWIGAAGNGVDRRVRPVAAAGLDLGYLEGLTVTWADNDHGQGPVGTAIRTRRTTICRDMRTDPKFALWRDEAVWRGYRSCVALPLATNTDVPVGALAIYAAEPDAFPDDEIHVLSEVAADIAYGISVLRLRAAHARAEQSLKQSEARLRLFIEHAPAALAMFDTDMRYLFASHRWLSDFGLAAADVIGSRHQDVFPDAPRRWQEVHHRCLAGAVETCDEDAFIRADGRTHWLRWEARPWYTDGKTVGGVVIMSEDITAANHAKSTFLTNMSHELRTPLTAILGFSQLLELDQDTAKSGQIAYCLDHIVKNGKLLLALINDLLDLARIDAGRLSTSPERVILADLVAGVAASLQPLADDIGLTLSIHGDAGLPDVRADQIRLTQVLLNLGTNAVKYNRPNGRVDVICQRLNPDWVRLTVADTGTGIPEARQGEVFQPFNRLGREAGSIEGTGIGLALSRRLMQSMGGRIGFSSRPGQGSRFWIDVPAYAAATAAQAPCGEAGAETETGTGAGTGAAPARTTDQGGSRTVLCVDDNAAARALVSKIVFGIPGTRVLTADTAEAGIALARRQPPDLILMDINLPGMDGVAALIELRRHAGTRDIPVFALSAATTAADIDRGLAAGFDRYLTKPYDARDLLTAVTSIRPASHLDGGTGPLNRRIMPGSSVRSEGVAA